MYIEFWPPNVRILIWIHHIRPSPTPLAVFKFRLFPLNTFEYNFRLILAFHVGSSVHAGGHATLLYRSWSKCWSSTLLMLDQLLMCVRVICFLCVPIEMGDEWRVNHTGVFRFCLVFLCAVCGMLLWAIRSLNWITHCMHQITVKLNVFFYLVIV